VKPIAKLSMQAINYPILQRGSSRPMDSKRCRQIIVVKISKVVSHTTTTKPFLKGTNFGSVAPSPTERLGGFNWVTEYG